MAEPPTLVFAKKKGAVPNRDNSVILSVFVFNSNQAFFNTIFQRNVLNRFTTPTDVYCFYWKHVQELLLKTWADSDHPDDTVADSMLPLPNLKSYYWKDEYVRSKIDKKNKKLSRTKRKRIDTSSIKHMMIDELMTLGTYVIEMRSTLFESIVKTCDTATHIGVFKIPSTLSQSEISRLQCSQPRVDNNVVGFLQSIGSFQSPSIRNNENEDEREDENSVHSGSDIDASSSSDSD
jgi:hypothetical protein